MQLHTCDLRAGVAVLVEVTAAQTNDPKIKAAESVIPNSDGHAKVVIP